MCAAYYESTFVFQTSLTVAFTGALSPILEALGREILRVHSVYYGSQSFMQSGWAVSRQVWEGIKQLKFCLPECVVDALSPSHSRLKIVILIFKLIISACSASLYDLQSFTEGERYVAWRKKARKGRSLLVNGLTQGILWLF